MVYARQLREETIVVAFNLSAQDVEVTLPLWQLGVDAQNLYQIWEGSSKVAYSGHFSVKISALSCDMWQVK